MTNDDRYEEPPSLIPLDAMRRSAGDPEIEHAIYACIHALESDIDPLDGELSPSQEEDVARIRDYWDDYKNILLPTATTGDDWYDLYRIGVTLLWDLEERSSMPVTRARAKAMAELTLAMLLSRSKAQAEGRYHSKRRGDDDSQGWSAHK